MVFDRKTKYIYDKFGKEYDKFREDYPKQLFNDLQRYVRLKATSKVLEIGCGTGKATLPLAKSCASILALDINKGMLVKAKENTRNYSNVRYLCNSFEAVVLPKNFFNLIFAAQAWHWINPKVGYAKVNRLLKDGGVYAVFWKSIDVDRSALLKKADKLYRKRCPKFNAQAHSVKLIENGIAKTKSFKLLLKTDYLAEKEYTKKEYLGLVGTWSWVAVLSNSKRNALFEDLLDLLEERKTISVPYKYYLLVFKKTS